LVKFAEDERKKFASELNDIKDELQNLIVSKIEEIEIKEINQKLEKEKIDITLPVKTICRG
jgi:phenylalanyl-tRNA synthetase alpha chain